MKEYIERDAFVETTVNTPFTMSMCSSVDECNGANMARLILTAIVKSLPAADVVEVQRGRWKGAGMGDYYCSLCQQLVSERTNYCPNCGAKMEEGEK